MASLFFSLLCLLASIFVIITLTSYVECSSTPSIVDVSYLNRTSFPKGFIFGTASSAFQYEGAANEGGRGPSIWDTFTHKYPEKITDRSNGDVANDEYHHYKEDVGIMKDMNLDAYRFSISWSRILPKGKLSGGVNPEGIKYYNNLINELLAKGLVPFVTLFHWDSPQALDDEYGGFLSPLSVKDFEDYAGVCFKEFGDRVKHWITLNEPWSFSMSGYAPGQLGQLAPGRCSEWLNQQCTGGDSGTEPYLVAHHQLLAHSAAVQLYRTKFQASQKGKIGITLISHWFTPLWKTKADEAAVLRSLDFMLGWFLDPITNGDYPKSMRHLVGARLPKFTIQQSKLLKGSFDFLGLNYYTTYFATDAPSLKFARPNYQTDTLVNLTADRIGVPIGPMSASSWLNIYPKGFRDLLLYVKAKYNNPLIYITENGVDETNDPTLTLEEALMDTFRIDYYYRHLYYLQSAIKDGVNVKGYFAWSLLDNFEWSSGYSVRFGINFVDYKNGNKRYPKLSAHWFKNFLNKPKDLKSK